MHLFLPYSLSTKTYFDFDDFRTRRADCIDRSALSKHLALPASFEFCANVDEILRWNRNVLVLDVEMFWVRIEIFYLNETKCGIVSENYVFSSVYSENTFTFYGEFFVESIGRYVLTEF